MHLVEAALAHVADSPARRALRVADLACGEGAWLTAAARRWPNAQLTGIDIDPRAIAIAAERLPGAQLRCGDGAKAGERERYDLVLGNPPWGAGRVRHVRRGEESVSRFSARAIESLAPGGRLCLLVPAAWLEVAAHRAARRHLLSTTAIERVEHLGDVFSGVFSPAALLIARREPEPLERAQQIIATPRGPVTQELFANDPDAVLNARVTPLERALLHKLDGARERLAGRARFILGVVTGDNQRALGDSGEPILTGGDVTPMQLSQPRRKLSLPLDQVQQAAPRSAYARDKIVYRFVARHPVAAVDRQGRLTLNSANALALEDPALDLDFVAAWLNSSTVRWVHRARQAMPRVLRSHLEKLPLPIANPTLRNAIAHAALDGNMDELDHRVMDLYALSDGERQLMGALQ